MTKMANVLKETVRGIDLVPLNDELFSSRELFLTSTIDHQSSCELIKSLVYLDRQDNSEITIYINSPGGEVISGLALFDQISMMRSPVRTVCIGTAASMGAIIFLAGQKRQMYPHAQLMIHDPSYDRNDISGLKPHEVRQELDKLNEVRKTAAEIISEKTGKPIKEVYKLTANDTFFTAQEAVASGFADEIVKGV